ncbi:MAG: DUF1697 domain-containing protein, partial [Gemmatimonadetes bacterium]|nr:DUF1697 domain-containing protein [Gemmatimonadota bacterium]NIR80501.1 DUF1697 domain-containing protein [Gemmatimonadota bacterium]NIT89262.1 DUF1697 domain-containing protein [Gemmatimonadota bacterium]NIU33061.1 DUF1697 domain-containing protein [Gemmatimonadota bacterium]NIU37442.1 DUF1697 domain-containing protein [Gemmatimonadota bacterium]
MSWGRPWPRTIRRPTRSDGPWGPPSRSRSGSRRARPPRDRRVEPGGRPVGPREPQIPGSHMSRHVAFLRGINLGDRRVKMDRLRRHFEAMDLGDVATFIASGNVIFIPRPGRKYRGRSPGRPRGPGRPHPRSEAGGAVVPAGAPHRI